jgi:hypothetical protein
VHLRPMLTASMRAAGLRVVWERVGCISSGLTSPAAQDCCPWGPPSTGLLCHAVDYLRANVWPLVLKLPTHIPVSRNRSWGFSLGCCHSRRDLARLQRERRGLLGRSWKPDGSAIQDGANAGNRPPAVLGRNERHADASCRKGSSQRRKSGLGEMTLPAARVNRPAPIFIHCAFASR